MILRNLLESQKMCVSLTPMILHNLLESQETHRFVTDPHDIT